MVTSVVYGCLYLCNSRMKSSIVYYWHHNLKNRKIRRLRHTVTEMHQQMQIIIITVVENESASLQSQPQCRFFKAVVKGSSFTSYKVQRGWTSTSTGLCSRAASNLINRHQCTQTHKDTHKHTPHLMTLFFLWNAAILDCMLWTGIRKLSKLQMIACSFLAYHYRECNQVNNSPILSIRQRPGK